MGVKLHDGFQEAYQLSNHLSFASATFLQYFPSVEVIEISPVAPEGTSWGNPQLLRPLLFEERPETIICFICVKIESAVKVDSLHWDALLETCLAKLGFFLAKQFPDKWLAVVDGIHHVGLQV